MKHIKIENFWRAENPRDFPAKEMIIVLGLIAAIVISGCTTSQQSPTSSNDAVLEIGKEAPDATFTTIDGEEQKLSDYRGEKVMFFVLATWCPTCQQGVRALQDNSNDLEDMQFIILKTYNNAGYPGPSIAEFVQQYAPQMLNAENWVWGDLSQKSTQLWNPKNYPDIYWLIDEKNTIQKVSGAPTATMGLIKQFVQSDGAREPIGEEFTIVGRNHVTQGTSVTGYNSNPPTSGPHWPQPADWGFYDKQLPDEQLVHNLEHGGIWITYKDIDASTKEKLRTLAQKYPDAVIVTSRSNNDASISVTSWGRLLKLEQYDEELIKEFINANVNNAPEPLADATQHRG